MQLVNLCVAATDKFCVLNLLERKLVVHQLVTLETRLAFSECLRRILEFLLERELSSKTLSVTRLAPLATKSSAPAFA